MYIYIHICRYVCICTCIHKKYVYTYMYMHIPYIYLYIHTHLLVYLYTYVTFCVCKCIYVHYILSECMYVYIYIYMRQTSQALVHLTSHMQGIRECTTMPSACLGRVAPWEFILAQGQLLSLRLTCVDYRLLLCRKSNTAQCGRWPRMQSSQYLLR